MDTKKKNQLCVMKKSSAKSKPKKNFILTNKNLAKVPLEMLRQMSMKKLKRATVNRSNSVPAELDRRQRNKYYLTKPDLLSNINENPAIEMTEDDSIQSIPSTLTLNTRIKIQPPKSYYELLAELTDDSSIEDDSSDERDENKKVYITPIGSRITNIQTSILIASNCAFDMIDDEVRKTKKSNDRTLLPKRNKQIFEPKTMYFYFISIMLLITLFHAQSFPFPYWSDWLYRDKDVYFYDKESQVGNSCFIQDKETSNINLISTFCNIGLCMFNEIKQLLTEIVSIV